MDFYSQKIENQKEMTVRQGNISAFGISLQGASHVLQTPKVPCQDAHDMRWLPGHGLLIAAIADGVGSCPLSHWGAYTAVQNVLDSVEQGIDTLAQEGPVFLKAEDPKLRGDMKQIMLTAFRKALAAVEQLAAEAEQGQSVMDFQSTLTLAIYDGDCLFHGHVGDDGIVAQLPDGTVEMATRRIKGEEANSVFPLQSGEKFWQFGLVPHVVGFVMATDGVLDSFVATKASHTGSDYFGGICYSFMENAIYGQNSEDPQAPQKILQEYKEFLLSDSYRQQVADDLTMAAVVSLKGLPGAVHPQFDIHKMKNADEINRQARQTALYGSAAQKKQQPAPRPISRPQIPQTPKAPSDSGAAAPQMPQTPEKPQKPQMPQTPEKPKKKKRRRFTWLFVILALLAGFGGGILLGRTVLAPVQPAVYEKLAQDNSRLMENALAINLEMEGLHEELQKVKSNAQKEYEKLQKQFAGILEEKNALVETLKSMEESTVETTEATEPVTEESQG